MQLGFRAGTLERQSNLGGLDGGSGSTKREYPENYVSKNVFELFR